MESCRNEFWNNIPARRGFVDITPQIELCLRESGIQEGLLLCNAIHITASVFNNDDENGLHHDYGVWLEELVPHEPLGQYCHNRTGEDNTDAHLKRQVMDREVIVAIINGKLNFNPGEQIFHGELNGRQQKRRQESYQDARKI